MSDVNIEWLTQDSIDRFLRIGIYIEKRDTIITFDNITHHKCQVPKALTEAIDLYCKNERYADLSLEDFIISIFNKNG